MPESDLVVGIRNIGISFFVFGDILYQQSEEFVKCMNGNSEIAAKIPTPVLTVLANPTTRTALLSIIPIII